MATKSNKVRQAVPDEKFALSTIRQGIPKEMFQQNAFKSMYYVARDVVQGIITASVMYYYGMPLIDTVVETLGVSSLATAILGNVFKFLVWNIYWYVQGLNGTGLWVMAHECGHRAFSTSKAVNDAVGMVLHSFLLVPYHSWRISHANHHKHTNHTELDTVFVPEKLAENSVREALNEAPIVSFIYMCFTFTVGWPLYLLFNVTGQKYNRRANHFEPSSPLYRPSEGGYILQSDVGLLCVALFFIGLVRMGVCGWYDILVWYFVPYLWVNFWLVFITYLQHTDTRLPHYNAENWNFVRGALAAVDRDFGFPINWWLHHINDSHVVHHLFSDMPFYNAIKVTRQYLPKLVPKETYMTDRRSLWAMLWDSWTNCRVIRPSDGISWFMK